MIKVANENELLDLFRPIDRDQVEVPPTLEFPLVIRDYVSWIESSGHRTYLVFQEPDGRRALGIVFKRGHPSGESVANMCDWCHSVRGSSSVGLLSVDASKNRRVGLQLCRDLQCKHNVRGKPGINDLRESITPDEKIFRIVQKMSEFAKRNLF